MGGYWEAIHLCCQQRSNSVASLLGLATNLLQRGIEEQDNYEVMQAFGNFDVYARLMGYTPGALYNCARAFHQVGLKHYAHSLYQQVLEEICERRKKGEEGEKEEI